FHSIYPPSPSIINPLPVRKRLTASFDQIKWSLLMSSIGRTTASMREEGLVLWGCLLTLFQPRPAPPHPTPLLPTSNNEKG
ncbi:unnamed protein product, partial [Hymenolepis diminuta]